MRTNRADGDLLTRIRRCAAVAFLSLVLFPWTGFAQAEPPKEPVKLRPLEPPKEQLTDLQRKVRELPRSATSADGFVEVLAADVPGDTMGFRLPLLRFTSQFVQDLEHAYGIQMPRAEGRGLVIHALDGQTNDVRVIARVVQRDGHVLTRLWLPSPGFTNLEALRFEIAQAYFRAWIDRHRPEGTKLADELPKWFVFGALNARTTEDAHTAIRAVLEMRMSKQLPAFPKFVLGMKRISSLQDAILAGYLVAWLKERQALVPLLERLAAGNPWSTEEMLVALTGKNTAEGQWQVFDARLDRLSRAVLSPGRASNWDLRNFGAQLKLDVVLDDDGDRSGGRTETMDFRMAIKRAAADLQVRQAASRKLRELPMYAVQRGPGMAAVSEAYSRFLVMLSRGADEATLGELLEAAEAKFKEVVDNGGQLAPPKTAEAEVEKKDENGKNDNR